LKVENPDEESINIDAADSLSMMLILEKGNCGRTLAGAIQALLKFMENAEQPLVCNKKPSVPATLEKCIDGAIKIGHAELRDRLEMLQPAGTLLTQRFQQMQLLGLIS
jgi:hypothetical protein